MSTPGKCYWIVYGFGEGPRHGRYFRAALEQAGFVPATSLRQADVVLAHSGGCLALPDVGQAQVILLQPPAAWQGSALRIWYAKTVCELRRHRQLGKLHRWAWKVSLNLAYLGRHPGRAATIVRLATQYRQQLPGVACRRLYVVCSQADPWSCHISTQSLPQQTTNVVGLPGSHDELWTNPAMCVQLVKRLIDHAA